LISKEDVCQALLVGGVEAASALPIFDGKAITTMMVRSEVDKDVRIFEREYQIDSELIEREVRPDAASPACLLIAHLYPTTPTAALRVATVQGLTRRPLSGSTASCHSCGFDPEPLKSSPLGT